MVNMVHQIDIEELYKLYYKQKSVKDLKKKYLQVDRNMKNDCGKECVSIYDSATVRLATLRYCLRMGTPDDTSLACLPNLIPFDVRNMSHLQDTIYNIISHSKFLAGRIRFLLTKKLKCVEITSTSWSELVEESNFSIPVVIVDIFPEKTQLLKIPQFIPDKKSQSFAVEAILFILLSTPNFLDKCQEYANNFFWKYFGDVGREALKQKMSDKLAKVCHFQTLSSLLSFKLSLIMYSNSSMRILKIHLMFLMKC